MLIQLAQYRFSGLVISNAKILKYFPNKIYRSPFVKQCLETVMVWNYQMLIFVSNRRLWNLHTILTYFVNYLLNLTYSLLEQVDTFPYLGPLITEDGECTTEFRTRLNRGRAIAAENMEKSRHIDFKEDTTDESASVACSNILLWKLDSQKNEETCLDVFEMKGLKKFCGFRGLQRKQKSGFLIKLE